MMMDSSGGVNRPRQQLKLEPETLDLSTCNRGQLANDDEYASSQESVDYISDVEEQESVDCGEFISFNSYGEAENGGDLSCGADSSADGNMEGDNMGSIYSSDQLYGSGPVSPKRICLVCSDTASGLHYGVASCEACKAFFKRTVQGNIGYACPAFGTCEINKRRRKACQSCRFQKCLAVGMLREGVRLDRVRGGRQKYRRSGDIFSPGMNFASNNYMQYIQKPLEAKDEDVKILPALITIEPDKVFAVPDHTLPDDDFKLMATLSDLADRELVATIGWAKQVPGFLLLPLPDQMNLLQSTWLDIVCFNEAYRSSPYDDVIVYADDFKCDEQQSKKLGIPTELDNVSRRLARKITSLNVTREEYVLLKAILLLNPDVNVKHPEMVQDLRDRVQDTLLEHLLSTQQQSATHANRRICNLFFLFPTLTHKKLLARDFWFGVKRSGRVILHKLLSEMLEFMNS